MTTDGIEAVHMSSSPPENEFVSYTYQSGNLHQKNMSLETVQTGMKDGQNSTIDGRVNNI